MKKLCKRILICAIIAGCVWTWGVIKDRETLNDELLRLHVVANSDSEEDQAVKLRVRDAVVESLREDLAKITDLNWQKRTSRRIFPRSSG